MYDSEAEIAQAKRDCVALAEEVQEPAPRDAIQLLGQRLGVLARQPPELGVCVVAWQVRAELRDPGFVCHARSDSLE